MSKEAMTLALEALRNHSGNYKLSKAECVKYNAVEKALEEALAKQEQGEPVATIRTWRKGGDQHAELWEWELGLSRLSDGEHLLYTTPQSPQKQEQDESVAWQVNGSMVLREDWIERLHWPFEYVAMGRAIPDVWVPVLYTKPQPSQKPLTEINIELLETLKWIAKYIDAAPDALTEAKRWLAIAQFVITKAEAVHGIKE
jgi:hypothetical protein